MTTTRLPQAQPQPLPKVSEVYTRFPLSLIKHLRQVADAVTPSDVFACYCHLLEWLGTYINNLANSVYVAQPTDAIDKRLERSLSKTKSKNMTFGVVVNGLQSFSESKVEFADVLPELKEVLGSPQLPIVCDRLLHAFGLIRKARDEYGMPPSRLRRYVADNLSADAELPGCTLGAFLRAVIPFRNMGMGHQAEESWFPRDRQMYGLTREYLDPAVDGLLTWSPLCGLLGRYEIVELAGPVSSDGRAPVFRPRVADGVAPLGGSRVLVPDHSRLVEDISFIVRRTEQPGELEGLVGFVRFPRPLQPPELLKYRYAEVYLRAYLDHGLITPTQRETTLAQPGLGEKDRGHIENEIQYAINLHSSDNPTARERAYARLRDVLGPDWSINMDEVATSLQELPERRKDYIYEQIENNTIMSFAELNSESGLSDPDLDTVLAELEEEERVRQIDLGVHGDRLNGYFKVQDPGRPAQLRTILEELRAKRGRRRGYPAPMRRLVELCAELLADDGLALAEGELEGYDDLFSDEDRSLVEDEEVVGDDDDMILHIGDDELRANSVRDLLTQVWELITTRDLDTEAVVPLLLGKTRYLLARRPEHANGTPFAIPIAVGDVVFEGSMTRDRALAEAIRLLHRLDIEASSPTVEPPREDSVDELEEEEEGHQTGVSDDEEEASEDTCAELMIELTPPGSDEATRIEGTTVRRFFAALVEFLVRHDAPLSEIVPVATGRVRYFLAEEPYHRNDRPFDSMIECEGYFVNIAYSYAQALSAAEILAAKLGWPAKVRGMSSDDDDDGAIPLKITIGDREIKARKVSDFLAQVITTLFTLGIFDASDIPYKSGRVRYLIAQTPTHEHGRDFIWPRELEVDGQRYFIETNVSRRGALELAERLVASKERELEAEIG